MSNINYLKEASNSLRERIYGDRAHNLTLEQWDNELLEAVISLGAEIATEASMLQTVNLPTTMQQNGEDSPGIKLEHLDTEFSKLYSQYSQIFTSVGITNYKNLRQLLVYTNTTEPFNAALDVIYETYPHIKLQLYALKRNHQYKISEEIKEQNRHVKTFLNNQKQNLQSIHQNNIKVLQQIRSMGGNLFTNSKMLGSLTPLTGDGFLNSIPSSWINECNSRFNTVRISVNYADFDYGYSPEDNKSTWGSEVQGDQTFSFELDESEEFIAVMSEYYPKAHFLKDEYGKILAITIREPYKKVNMPVGDNPLVYLGYPVESLEEYLISLYPLSDFVKDLKPEPLVLASEDSALEINYYEIAENGQHALVHVMEALLPDNISARLQKAFIKKRTGKTEEAFLTNMTYDEWDGLYKHEQKFLQESFTAYNPDETSNLISFGITSLFNGFNGGLSGSECPYVEPDIEHRNFVLGVLATL